MKASHGFTLLEVLVALAILALALLAALRASAVATQNAEALRLRQLASWVAQDRLEEHRARRQWLPVGSQNGAVEQGGERFRWEEKVGATPNSQFRRIEIRVQHVGQSSGQSGGLSSVVESDGALAQMTGFLVKQ